MADLGTIPRQHPVVKAVATALRRRCGVLPRTHLLVAVSGGADSVALLRALHLLSQARSWRLPLTVAHVQHHLRPLAQAEGDAIFVQRLAEALQLPFVRADLDPSGWQGNVEASARRRRYQSLWRLAHDCGAQALVTGHHADDQLETLLMRLVRGTSVAGLSGIAWRRRLSVAQAAPSGGDASASSLAIHARGLPLLRPMLALDHRQLCDFLGQLQQPWREDSTNQDSTRWRARLRWQVLPVLRQMRPGVARISTQEAEHFRQWRRVIIHLRRQAMRQVDWRDGQALLARSAARAMNPPVLADLLRDCLRRLGIPGDERGQRKLGPLVQAVRDTAGGQRIFNLGGGITMCVTRESVVIGGPAPPVPPVPPVP